MPLSGGGRLRVHLPEQLQSADTGAGAGAGAAAARLAEPVRVPARHADSLLPLLVTQPAIKPSLPCHGPCQEFFEKDMGLPLTMTPNYEDFSCQ